MLTVQEIFQLYAELLLDEKASEKKRLVNQLISDLNLGKTTKKFYQRKNCNFELIIDI